MKNEHDAIEKDNLSTVLPLIPTVDVVVFPQMVVPLLVLDEKIIRGINQALEGSKEVLLLAARSQGDSEQQPIGPQDLFDVGTVGRVMRVMSMPDGGMKILAQGLRRVRVSDVIATDELLSASIEEHPFDEDIDAASLDAKMRELTATCERVSAIGGIFNQDFHVIFSQIDEPTRAIDFLLSHLSLDVEQFQELLEKGSLLKLLDELQLYLEQEIESSRLQERVRNNAREAINKSQREYYLREQLRAIQKELGEESDAEFEELKARINQDNLPKEAFEEATRQVRRLERTSQDSLEATVIRNHLEWLLTLPWKTITKDNLDIDHAMQILDKEHFGLEKVKDRILDFLSIKAFQKGDESPILCFTGPPGVGKTSLGKSIAHCLNRNFFRIALGGVHDESELRGHRRTYVGALPGRIMQAVHKAASLNPVLMIDEIDKLGNSGRGDPASALLEVLDPEQNSTFHDNYLGVHFDLSKVMFITTSNDVSAIPGPLRDRMEIIELSGYSLEEKLQICKRHLAPRAIERSGLADRGLVFSDDLLRNLIGSYTQEAGVRTLFRYLQKLCSKYARSLLESDKPIEFTPENLIDYLGPCHVSMEKKKLVNRIGVTNGLAWTPYGGVMLRVEAVLMSGTGKLILTGQLGDVMRESAQAAVSYLRSRAEFFGIDNKVFTGKDLHIHLPAGAVPKDGPSAGVSLFSSILSVITNRPIDGSVAMTGEVDLQGGVLPIGGVKEKLLAAKQYGITTVLLPEENRKDLHGMEDLIGDLKVVCVEKIEDVVDRVLLKATTT